jgi:hypothetical protein
MCERGKGEEGEKSSSFMGKGLKRGWRYRRERGRRGITGGITGGNCRVDCGRRKMTWGSHMSEKQKRKGKK